MAFYFAKIWFADSAAKLVLIAAVLVAKISAAKTKTFCLTSSLLWLIGYLHCKAGGFHFKRNEPTTILL